MMIKNMGENTKKENKLTDRDLSGSKRILL